MSLSALEKHTPTHKFDATAPRPLGRTPRKVLSINQGSGAFDDDWKSAVASPLRSRDPELHEILSALEEIADGLRAGVINARQVESALRRAASSAVRQSQIDREIRNLAVTDELTGLYNRRGFLAAATHQLKLAHRNGEDVLLLFCDVDNLKEIHDSFGHYEGDLALIRAAGALKATFRDSDVIARLGGDEFAVLASDASIPSRQAIVPRIASSLEQVNAARLHYKLSFSIGLSRFDPHAPASLTKLMARADEEMYAHKRSRRESSISRNS